MTELALRSVHDIAVEIISIKDFTRSTLVHGSIEIGKRLVEAKSLLVHGEWGKWLEQSVDYSQSTANNLMRIAEEYGDTNSQTLRNLSYSQAVALLAVPADEREQFAEQNDAENLSTRELQQAIKEKQEAENRAKDAEKEAEQERKARQKLELQSKDHALIVERLNEQIAAAQASGDTDTADTLADELAESQRRIKELETQLKEKPIDVPGIVEKASPEMEAELTQLRLSQKNSKQAAKFTVYFESLVKGFGDLLSVLGEIKEADPDGHEKYKAAVTGLIGKMSEKVSGDRHE